MSDKGQKAQRIPGYEPGGGSEAADEALAGVSKMFGGDVPNFHKVLATSPTAITAFAQMRQTMQKTKIRAAEREIIALEVSRRNRCDYCLAAHKAEARMRRVPEDDIEAAATGKPMQNPRHALVQRATQMLIDTRARLSEEQLEVFRSQGLSDGELIEIIAVIGWYVWSTFVNNLAHTEIDPYWGE